MTIEKTTNGNHTELILNGWLDAQSAPLLDAALEELGPETESLSFELGEMAYLSSAGLRRFLVARKQMNGAVTLKHVRPETMEILHLTGLDNVFNIEQ